MREAIDGSRSEYLAENSSGVVVVVHKVDQVSEHQQCIGTVACSGQRVRVAVHVGDHMDPHGPAGYRRGLGLPGTGLILTHVRNAASAGLLDETSVAIRLPGQR